jgi:hypothetical protein
MYVPKGNERRAAGSLPSASGVDSIFCSYPLAIPVETLRHPALPEYELRVTEPKLCDETVKQVSELWPIPLSISLEADCLVLAAPSYGHHFSTLVTWTSVRTSTSGSGSSSRGTSLYVSSSPALGGVIRSAVLFACEPSSLSYSPWFPSPRPRILWSSG